MEVEKRKRGRPRGTTKAGAVRYLSEEELARFFKQAKRSKKENLLFNLILYFGLRSAEAAELELTDFDWDNLTVTITAKKSGRKRPYPEVPGEIWAAFHAYMKVRRAHRLNKYVFPHRFHSKPLDHMSPIGIQWRFKEICERAGISGHSVHDLRHTCGRRLAQQDLSAMKIARHLRQRETSSAQVYIDLREDHETDRKIREGWKVY
jgi:integrase